MLSELILDTSAWTIVPTLGNSEIEESGFQRRTPTCSQRRQSSSARYQVHIG